MILKYLKINGNMYILYLLFAIFIEIIWYWPCATVHGVTGKFVIIDYDLCLFLLHLHLFRRLIRLHNSVNNL